MLYKRAGIWYNERRKLLFMLEGDDMKDRRLMITAAGAVILLCAAVIIFLAAGGHGEESTGVTESLIIYENSSVSDGSGADGKQDIFTESAVTADESSGKEYISCTFRTKKQFDGHYEKHGKEFGDITQEEYLKKANDLINNDSDTILHKTEAEDGDQIFYDTVNNEILFLSADGYIRTYFRPSRGIDYYNDQ